MTAVVGVVLSFVVTAVASGATAPGEGALNPAFGNHGVVVSAEGTGSANLLAVTTQPDGRILAAGWLDDASSRELLAVARYLPTGKLDTSFARDGIATTTVGDANAAANGIALNPDGTIIVVGSCDSAGAGGIGIVRFTSSGAVDKTFGTNGKVCKTLALGAQPQATSLQPDGKILVAGYEAISTFDVTAIAVRFTAGGVPDSGFGTGGVFALPSGSDPVFSAVTPAPGGRVLLAGYSKQPAVPGFLVVRLTAAGKADDGFADHGVFQQLLGTSSAEASTVVVLPSGRIVAAGDANKSAHEAYAMVGLTSSGTLDPTFGASGTVVANVGDKDASIRSAALTPAGKIVVAGLTESGSTAWFGTARYLQSGLPDPSFDGDGFSGFPLDPAGSYVAAMTISPNGQVIVVGDASNKWGMAAVIGDATPPFDAHVLPMPRFSASTRPVLSWLADDDNTGVASFDLETRSAAFSQPTYGAEHVVKSKTPLPYGSVTTGTGRTYCLRVRARDRAGNAGPYSAERCTAIPIAAKQLTAHGRWSKLHNKALFAGGGRQTTHKGAKLSARAYYRSLALVATTCKTCGKVVVMTGSTKLATINLHSTHTGHHVVIPLTTGTTTKHAVVTIKTLSRKTVIIEGLGASLA